MSVFRMFLTVSTSLVLLGAIGCQSSPTGSSPAVEAPGRAIVVSGNSGSYTVFVPAADHVHADAYVSSGGPVCPDCKAAAEHYFLTGELVPKCPITGAMRTPVSLATPYVSHN